MAVEHLVLRQKTGLTRFPWITRYHKDLGDDLQNALDLLTAEGWEVVCAVEQAGVPSAAIILKRQKTDGIG